MSKEEGDRRSMQGLMALIHANTEEGDHYYSVWTHLYTAGKKVPGLDKAMNETLGGGKAALLRQALAQTASKPETDFAKWIIKSTKK